MEKFFELWYYCFALLNMNKYQRNGEKPYLGSPDNPKTAAIVCYITFIGWLIAYFLIYRANKDEFSGFHLRHTLLLHIISFIVNFLAVLYVWERFPYVLLVVISGLLLVCWLIGVWGAINGKKKAAPFIGSFSQKLFSSI